jgi:hypothetical protein
MLIFRVYSERAPERGAKQNVASQLGMSPFELARQFRQAEGLLLEVYYIAGVLAPPSTLNDPALIQRCLDIYDEINGPKRLKTNDPYTTYWSPPDPGQRLQAGHRSLLKTAARSMTREDVAYLNAAVTYGMPPKVHIDRKTAATLYLKARNDQQDHGKVASDPAAAAAYAEQFSAALHQAETHFASLITEAHQLTRHSPFRSVDVHSKKGRT